MKNYCQMSLKVLLIDGSIEVPLEPWKEASTLVRDFVEEGFDGKELHLQVKQRNFDILNTWLLKGELAKAILPVPGTLAYIAALDEYYGLAIDLDYLGMPKHWDNFARAIQPQPGLVYYSTSSHPSILRLLDCVTLLALRRGASRTTLTLSLYFLFRSLKKEELVMLPTPPLGVVFRILIYYNYAKCCSAEKVDILQVHLYLWRLWNLHHPPAEQLTLPSNCTYYAAPFPGYLPSSPEYMEVNFDQLPADFPLNKYSAVPYILPGVSSEKITADMFYSTEGVRLHIHKSALHNQYNCYR